MKTPKPRFTASRMYRGGCLLALLGMVATATALDKPTPTKTTSGKPASRTTPTTTKTSAAKTATKTASSARAARDKKRLKELELVRLKREARFFAREATVRAEVLRSIEVGRKYPGYISPYGAGGVSYGSGSGGPLVVDAAKAELKTDPEQERDLVRADEFARQGKYQLAIGFWQRVLDASTASVMTRDEWKFKGANHSYQKFRSIADEVERSIGRLPKQGLKTYRLQVDGNAQAILAAGAGARREEALSVVVRKYFLSSLGDDAAFELACLNMDRGEFIGASRLLAKILSGYPEPSVPRNEIQLRLAVAQSRLGDRRAAEAALVELRKDPPRGSQQLLAAIEADVKNGTNYVSTHDLDSSTSWPMSLGGASRSGHMKAPAALRAKSNLTEFWSHEIDLGFTRSAGQTSQKLAPKSYVSGISISDGTSSTIMLRESKGSYVSYIKPYSTYQPVNSTTSQKAGDASELISRWREKGWMPAGQVLLDGRRMYVKTLVDLICLDTETNKILWRSVRKNHFELDGMTQRYAQMGVLRNGGHPQHPLDVQVFGDSIHQSMTLAGDLIVSIEGKSSDDPKATTSTPPAVPTPTYYYGPQTIHRKRNNWLSAYDAKSGKRRWTRRAGEDREESASEAGFLAAPVPYARLLLVPVINSGEIWMKGLDRDTGKTVWKTNLCDEPSNGAAPWSPVGIAIDGGEAYVATGAGVVFAVNAMSGGVRWAFRYPRVGRGNLNMQQRYGYGGTTAQILDMEGMDEDVVIPSGKVLVVMASDYHEMFAIDRRTGEFVWDTPLKPNEEAPQARYCLGVFGDSVYIGSNQVVRRYKLRGGSLVWERKLENTTGNTPPSLGRGIVTDAAVYVPLKDSVVKLSHADGREVEQYGVVLKDHQPVGNLYSDGQRLFVLGPGQVSALGDIKIRMKTLDERVRKGDLDAQLERMDIRGRTKDVTGAFADLKAVLGRFKTGNRTAEIAPVLLKAIATLELALIDPVATLDVLSVYQDEVAKAADKSHLKQRNVLVRASLIQLLKKPGADTVAAILKAGPLFGTRDLFDVAQQAMRQHSVEGNLTALTAAMTGPPASRRLAILGLSRLKAPALDAILKKALADPDEMVRLDASVVLCNRGERDGLAVMVALLSSGDFSTRQRTASFLTQMTGKSFGYLPYESADSRAKAVKQWQEWVTAEGKSAALRPVSPVRVFFGRTLIANQANNFVDEYDESGRRTQHLAVSGPTAVQGLPNGHRLVASATELAVIEYDEGWKPVGRISTAKYGTPYSVQRLDNGNTLVACFNSTSTAGAPATRQGNVLEYDPKGEIKWRFQYGGMITHAQRLENGNTLVSVYSTYATRSYPSLKTGGFGKGGGIGGGRPYSRVTSTVGKVLEVNPQRSVVRQFTHATYPWSANRLANGNTLIVDANQSRVLEVDVKNQVVWSRAGISTPRGAQRLSNGHTLVTHYNGVTEFDADGKLVWNRGGSSVLSAMRY